MPAKATSAAAASPISSPVAPRGSLRGGSLASMAATASEMSGLTSLGMLMQSPIVCCLTPERSKPRADADRLYSAGCKLRAGTARFASTATAMLAASASRPT